MPSLTLTRRGIKVTAETTFEVQVNLSGVFVPGCEAWGGGRFERPTNPSEPDAMEDIEVTGVGGLKRELSPANIRGSHMWTYRVVDLLEGVDPKSAAYQQITANILKFLGDDAERELLSEVESEEA